MAVIGRIGDDGHGLKILGGAANHRRPSDVDLLDGLRQGDIAGDCGLERIEVYDNEVDGKKTVCLDLLFVLLRLRAGKAGRRGSSDATF